KTEALNLGAKISAMEKELKLSDKPLKEKDAKIASLEKEIKDKGETLAALQAEKERMAKELAEMGNSKTDLTELKQERDEYRAQADNLSAKIKALESRGTRDKDLEAANREIDKDKKVISDQKKAAEISENTIKAKDTEISRLEKIAKANESKASEAEKALAKSRDNAEALEQEQAKLEQEIKSLKLGYDELKKKTSGKAVSGDSSIAEKASAEYKAEIQRLSKELNMTKMKLELSESSQEGKDEIITDLTQQLEERKTAGE
ncbi:MAG: hypothetical protein HQL30_10865, partial [Candidatus Omnitrophica bacterium]|nr:hypothetical protein [Candidatus Omnitrophota bacterium]